MPANSVLVNIFCENVRRLRMQRGVTQAEMANRLGVTQATYSRLESGVRTPDLPVLGNIAEALGVDPSDLIAPAEKLTAAS